MSMRSEPLREVIATLLLVGFLAYVRWLYYRAKRGDADLTPEWQPYQVSGKRRVSL